MRNLISCTCFSSKPANTEYFSRSINGGYPWLFRSIVLAWALVITTWSLSAFWGPIRLWLLYMTHWGLLFILLESAFGLGITLAGRTGRLPDATFGLPWYVKTYWLLYNTAIPVAFLITIFYWVILKAAARDMVDYAPNLLLDISIHAINSVLMLGELLTAGHPSRLLHIYQPVGLGLIYLLFGVIYYYAGGVDPWGNPWVYPVVDWSKPGPTGVVVTLTALFLMVMHLLTVVIATARDVIARRLVHSDHSKGLSNDAFVAA